MSIKTDAVVIRDETTTGANTAVRVGTNLVDIADDLAAKQAAIDLNTAKETNTDTIYDDTAIQAEVDLNTAKVGITPTQVADIVTNNAKVGVTTEEANPDVVSQVEAEAGIATDERIWTAERVKQAIVALGGSGSVDDTAYGISWDGVIGVAPSKNVLYDFIESQVFKVDVNSNILPLFWGGTQAEYDAYFNITDFPSGVPNNYFTVITNGVPPVTSASDIVNVPSGNLVADNVQGALDELQTEVDGLSGGGLVAGDIDTLAELNAIVTDATLIDTADARLSDARTPTAHTHVEADITDLGTYSTDIHANIIALDAVSGTNTGDNAVNTLYSGLETNATHTGEVTGSSVLTLDATAISNKTLDVALAGTEEVLMNDAGTLKKTTTQAIADLGGGGGNFLEATLTINAPIDINADYQIIAAQGVNQVILPKGYEVIAIDLPATTGSITSYLSNIPFDGISSGSATLKGVPSASLRIANVDMDSADVIASDTSNLPMSFRLTGTTETMATGTIHVKVYYTVADVTTGF